MSGVGRVSSVEGFGSRSVEFRVQYLAGGVLATHLERGGVR